MRLEHHLADAIPNQLAVSAVSISGPGVNPARRPTMICSQASGR